MIIWRVELKFRWTKHGVLSVFGVDNADNNDDTDSQIIIFTIKDTRLYTPVVTLTEKDNQKLLKCRSKGFERSVFCNEYKKE